MLDRELEVRSDYFYVQEQTSIDPAQKAGKKHIEEKGTDRQGGRE